MVVKGKYTNIYFLSSWPINYCMRNVEVINDNSEFIYFSLYFHHFLPHVLLDAYTFTVTSSSWRMNTFIIIYIPLFPWWSSSFQSLLCLTLVQLFELSYYFLAWYFFFNLLLSNLSKSVYLYWASCR